MNPNPKEPNKNKVTKLRQQIAPKLLFDPTSHPEHAQDNSGGKKQLPFNRKKPLAEPNLGKATTVWGLRGQERVYIKHHNTRPGIAAQKEKHKLMTTI